MKKKDKTLAIDFDGVVHDFKHPIEGRKMGKPIHGTEEALDFFKRRGWTIIVHSVWGDKAEIISKYMDYYNLPYDEITNVKPKADYYIDDNAIRFDTWDSVIIRVCQQ